MQAEIAIVVVAYNRPYALLRLLSSLKEADYSGYSNVSLFVSIDYSGVLDCFSLANEFVWPYGHKQIIQFEENLGLKKHILQCGDISLQFDAVIVLEDDLFVSPAFYDYAQQAYCFYKDDSAIAGVGLYSYRYNEIAYCPFEAIADGYDNYFLQVPCSWGQMWTKPQWQLFKDSISEDEFKAEHPMLPEQVKLWPIATSWKKLFYSYLVSAGRYFIYPRISLTTNFGDIGQHYDNQVMVWQTSLLLKTKQFCFTKLSHSTSIYDAFFELEPLQFQKIMNLPFELCIDLNGIKPLAQISTQYLISSKKCMKPIKKYPLALYPYENNILFELDDNNVREHYFSLGLTSDFKSALNVDRRSVDITRLFLKDEDLTVIGRNEVYRTEEYKIGKTVLKPVLFLKRLLRIK